MVLNLGVAAPFGVTWTSNGGHLNCPVIYKNGDFFTEYWLWDFFLRDHTWWRGLWVKPKSRPSVWTQRSMHRHTGYGLYIHTHTPTGPHSERWTTENQKHTHADTRGGRGREKSFGGKCRKGIIWKKKKNAYETLTLIKSTDKMKEATGWRMALTAPTGNKWKSFGFYRRSD